MAKIKLSAIGITNLSGKAGGSVFSKNKGGSYMKNFVVPNNPQTASQSLQRSNFGGLSSAWRGLTQEQRRSWISSAINFPYIDVFGDSKNLSGNSLFISLNRNLSNAQEENILSAPNPQGTQPVVTLPTFGAVLNTTSGNSSVTIRATLGEAVASATVFLVYMTANVSPGINNYSGRYRLVSVVDSADIVTPTILSPEYRAIFGDNSVGSSIGLKIIPINSVTGEAGAAFFSRTLVTALE